MTQQKNSALTADTVIDANEISQVQNTTDSGKVQVMTDKEVELINKIRRNKSQAYQNGLAQKPLSPLLPKIQLANSSDEESLMLENALDTLWQKTKGPYEGAEPPEVRELICTILKWQIKDYRSGLSKALKNETAEKVTPE